MHQQLSQAVVQTQLEHRQRLSVAREARASASNRRGWLFPRSIRRSRPAAGTPARPIPAR
jgi:hypothetical protein